MKVDYHIHSVKSDGDLNIYDLIKGAKDNDCKSISITDHDIIDDYSLISNSEKIEIINGKQEKELTNIYENIAKDLNLIKTVGSDFHSIDNKLGINFQEEDYLKFINSIR